MTIGARWRRSPRPRGAPSRTCSTFPAPRAGEVLARSRQQRARAAASPGRFNWKLQARRSETAKKTSAARRAGAIAYGAALRDPHSRSDLRETSRCATKSCFSTVRASAPACGDLHMITSGTSTLPRKAPPRPRHASRMPRLRLPTRCRYGARALATLPKLELIAMAATGYDVVDAEHCRASDITVVNIRNYAAHTVPEQSSACAEAQSSRIPS